MKPVRDRKQRIYAASVQLPLEYRNTDGSEVVLSKLDKGVTRQKLEEKLLLGSEVGLNGYDRCHAQGAGTGYESEYGIFYGPSKLNRVIQNKGIEKYLREVVKLYKDSNVEFRLLTVATPHPGTKLLANIEYELHAWTGNALRILLGVSISISNNTNASKITVEVAPNCKWDQARYV